MSSTNIADSTDQSALEPGSSGLAVARFAEEKLERCQNACESFDEPACNEVVAIDETLLGKLESERDEVAQRLEAKQDLLKSLNHRAICFQESLRTLKKARRGLIQSNIIRSVLFLALLYPLITALSLLIAPDSALSDLSSDLMNSQFPTWEPTDLWVLVNSSIAIFILLACTWGLCFLLKKRVAALQQAPKQLADLIAELDSVANEADQATADHLAERHALRQKVLDLSVTPEEMDHYLEQERPWLQGVIEQSEAELAEHIRCSREIEELTVGEQAPAKRGV